MQSTGYCASWLPIFSGWAECAYRTAILNLREHIKNKLFLDRTRKDSNFKRPHICATLFQIEKCCIVDAGIVGDHGQTFHATVPDGLDQGLRNAAEAEAAGHDRHIVEK